VSPCEPSISLPVPAEACLQTSFLDTSPCALSSGTPTAAPCSESAPPTAGSPACTCTRETFGCSIHPRGRAEWIASMRASLARTSARLVAAQASAQERDPVCGERLSAWPITFDPSGSCWRTAQESLVAASRSWSGAWPRSGMMRGGTCWALPMLARTTTDTAGGACAGELRVVNGRVAKLPTPTAQEFSASEASAAARKAKHGRVSVTLSVWLRLPRVPTPTASAAKQGGRYGNGSPTLASAAGGRLNPTWVEWLMAWPLGWTAVAPASRRSATGKSRSAPRRRGACSEVRSA
jgi:hypothetical protein